MDSATEEEKASVEEEVGDSSPAMVRRRKALGGKNPKYRHALLFSSLDGFFRRAFYTHSRQHPALVRVLWTFRLAHFVLLRSFEFHALPAISRSQSAPSITLRAVYCTTLTGAGLVRIIRLSSTGNYN